eukprot:2479212-Pyramimonas_sp.AAC.1
MEEGLKMVPHGQPKKVYDKILAKEFGVVESLARALALEDDVGQPQLLDVDMTGLAAKSKAKGKPGAKQKAK